MNMNLFNSFIPKPIAKEKPKPIVQLNYEQLTKIKDFVYYLEPWITKGGTPFLLDQPSTLNKVNMVYFRRSEEKISTLFGEIDGIEQIISPIIIENRITFTQALLEELYAKRKNKN